ncbi:MAG TPA: cysteine--tRNA ligase [Dehalococcoidia bacterium]|nr:cysteine--tRNA ligase [Dehalococcoidia bacterium]
MRLYSTQSRKVEEFAPASDNTVRMYVCGPNLYAPCHVGHAMSYIIFDVLRRYLEFRGYEVRHVQNFTDIEDNIIIRAQKENTTIDALAEKHVEQFYRDMDALNVQRAHVYPRASHEIPGIIELIEKLIEKGHAYEAAGDIYFRVRSKADYGKLSGRDVDSLMAGARIEPGEHKEDPADFALWKATKPGEPAWDSPWGPGRPGWHIECSAMSLRYLGETVDIHGGGQDLIFPHHENEIAQTESATGVVPFVRFWVHNGLLRLSDDEEKMTRHLGNLIPIDEVLERFGRDALRIFILGSNYRSPLTYSIEILESAARGAQRLRTAAGQTGGEGRPALDPLPYRQRFLDSMEDDFNTAGAIAALFDLAREINRGRDEGRDIAEAVTTLRSLAGDVLGLTLEEREGDLTAAPFIELLIQTREHLRTQKLYELADTLRNRLTELGVTLEDSPDGTRWRYGG